MEHLRLVAPSKEYEKEIFDYREEMRAAGNAALEGCGSLDRYDCYEDWISHLEQYKDRKQIDPKSGYVEGSQYLFVDEERHRVLGMVNLRHYLNDALFRIGGHIGYSIRPSERGKGYGKLQLFLALQILKGLGVENALLACDSKNIPSAKTIEACGGVFEKEVFIPEFKCTARRYWIHLS